MRRSNKDQIAEKIQFLENQIKELDRYLPETYQYLMEELDNQKYLWIRQQIQDRFQEIESGL